MRYNVYRLPIVEAGCDLISNEAHRAWRLQESLQRLREMSASAKNHQAIELANQTSDVTMGAVNAALYKSEVDGQLLPGFFEVRPDDLRLFRKEGEQ